MIETNTLLNSTKKLSILYVEDDLELQTKTNTLFKEIFKEIFVASSEQEGLELFKDIYTKDKAKINVVVADFNMLNMIKYITDVSDIQIVLLSEFNSKDFFAKIVELKITNFLFKPFKELEVVELFQKISKSIEDEKSLKLFKSENEEENSQDRCEANVFLLADACILPVIIYKDNMPVYSTEAFKKLITYNCSQRISVFEKKNGYITNLKEYNKDTPFSNKIKIKQKVGNRFFKVLRKDIELGSCKESYMYMLIDITLETYQRVKIDSYLKSLEILSIRQKREISDLRHNKTEPIEDSKEVTSEPSSENVLKIDSDMKSTLRKRHHHIMTSKELVDSMDITTLGDLQELDDLDNDLKDAMEFFNDNNFSTIPLVSELLLKYAKEIKGVGEFEDLYRAIKSLADILYSIDISSIKEAKYTELSLYLNSIREDLSSWRQNIFIEQNSDNIHYLDSSLFSTALHIELLIAEKEDINYQTDDESDDDDLEFF